MTLFMAICLLTALLSACHYRGTLTDGSFQSSDTQYTLGDPGPTWQQVSLRGVDTAWIKKNNGSSLMVNSDCKEFQDIPLIALTWQLLIGMTEGTLLEQKTVPWSGREALETIITAKMDGVLSKLKIFVMKKDGCVYDVILASDPSHFEENLKAYDSVLQHFDVGARK